MGSESPRVTNPEPACYRSWSLCSTRETTAMSTPAPCSRKNPRKAAKTQISKRNKCDAHHPESSAWTLRDPQPPLPGCLPWGQSQVWSDGREQRLEPVPESTQHPQGTFPPPPLAVLVLLENRFSDSPPQISSPPRIRSLGREDRLCLSILEAPCRRGTADRWGWKQVAQLALTRGPFQPPLFPKPLSLQSAHPGRRGGDGCAMPCVWTAVLPRLGDRHQGAIAPLPSVQA